MGRYPARPDFYARRRLRAARPTTDRLRPPRPPTALVRHRRSTGDVRRGPPRRRHTRDHQRLPQLFRPGRGASKPPPRPRRCLRRGVLGAPGPLRASTGNRSRYCRRRRMVEVAPGPATARSHGTTDTLAERRLPRSRTPASARVSGYGNTVPDESPEGSLDPSVRTQFRAANRSTRGCSRFSRTPRLSIPDVAFWRPARPAKLHDEEADESKSDCANECPRPSRNFRLAHDVEPHLLRAPTAHDVAGVGGDAEDNANI